MKIILIIVAIIAVFFIFKAVLSSSSPQKSRIPLYTDDNTKKAFISYIIASAEQNWGGIHSSFDGDEGLLFVKHLIEISFDLITTGKSATFAKKGAFSVYPNQRLTPENKVYMDLIEILLFGDVNESYNRAEDLPDDVLNNIRISLWTLHRFLTNDDPDTREEKAEGARAYDELFANVTPLPSSAPREPMTLVNNTLDLSEIRLEETPDEKIDEISKHLIDLGIDISKQVKYTNESLQTDFRIVIDESGNNILKKKLIYVVDNGSPLPISYDLFLNCRIYNGNSIIGEITNYYSADKKTHSVKASHATVPNNENATIIMDINHNLYIDDKKIRVILRSPNKGSLIDAIEFSNQVIDALHDALSA